MEKLTAKDYLLSIQHLFAMFGATILVPIATGLNPAVALVTAGIGTLLFHLCTKFKVPVFLGSSFAFIPAISAIVNTMGIDYAQGGIMAAGLVYVLLALIVFAVGSERVKSIFPPVVTGPIILVIGVSLSGTAINDALNGIKIAEVGMTGDAWLSLGIATFTLATVIICTIFAKGFFKLVPILIGMASGYALCSILGAFGIFAMDYSKIIIADWFNIPYYTEGFFSLPKFSWTAVLTIAPIALVTFMEHIGDITTNGTVVGKNFFADPGLHRTLLGDGIATCVAGFLGGPANTTYAENTGVLATTKNYNPRLLRITAIFAIIFGFIGKFGAALQSIPGPVKGGVEMMLFGMIASIGIRTLAEANLDFTNSRNLAIVAVILTTGIGIGAIDGIPLVVGSITMKISGLFVATVVGVLLNLILPKNV